MGDSEMVNNSAVFANDATRQGRAARKRLPPLLIYLIISASGFILGLGIFYLLQKIGI